MRGVAVVLAAIPEHLDQREQEVAVERIGVGDVERHRVEVEVAAAAQEQRVVGAERAEDAALHVLRDRDHRAAEDPALAVAVVVDRAAVEQRRAARVLERGVRREPTRVAQQAREEREVEDPLLAAVGNHLEERQVDQRGRHVRQIAGREAEPVDRAEHVVVLAADVVDAVVGDRHAAVEQAVAVDARLRGAAHERDLGDLAHVPRRHRADRIGQPVAVERALRITRIHGVGRVVEEPVRRRARALPDPAGLE